MGIYINIVIWNCHFLIDIFVMSLQWNHNECGSISKYRHLECLLNSMFRHRSKKRSKLHVTGLYEGNPLVMGGFPSQRASNIENASIWWHAQMIVLWYVYLFGRKWLINYFYYYWFTGPTIDDWVSYGFIHCYYSSCFSNGIPLTFVLHFDF